MSRQVNYTKIKGWCAVRTLLKGLGRIRIGRAEEWKAGRKKPIKRLIREQDFLLQSLSMFFDR